MSMTSWEDYKQSGLASFVCNAISGPDWPYWWSGHYIPAPDFEFFNERYTSIWIGVFPNAKTVEFFVECPAYGDEDVMSPLWDDLGFEIPFESIAAFFCHQELPVGELIRSRPDVENIADDLIEAVKLSGIQKGNTVLVIDGLDMCDDCVLAFGCFRFIGSFQRSHARDRVGEFRHDDLWERFGW